MFEYYKFINQDGVEEKVNPEKWSWGVVYNDGTELKQFDDNGYFHQFKEINQDEVKMFVMLQLEDIVKRIDIPLENYKQYQIFHFYRQFVLYNDNRRVKVYVFGWKDKYNGATSYNFILPDDRIITSPEDIKDLTNFNL